jgi:plasmid maintenance system antidote protein VapI
MTDLDLERQIRQVLAQLELVSHGTITAYNSSGGHAAESGRALPPGELKPPHEFYRQQFAETTGDHDRSKLLEQAQAELGAITKRPIAIEGLTDAQILEEKILEKDGWSDVDLAKHLRCTSGHVRRVRNSAGKDGVTGELLELSAVDRSDLAAAMQTRGLNQEEIAKRMGISQPTVSRLLRTRRQEAA